jgi:hypothetical protein
MTDDRRDQDEPVPDGYDEIPLVLAGETTPYAFAYVLAKPFTVRAGQMLFIATIGGVPKALLVPREDASDD